MLNEGFQGMTSAVANKTLVAIINPLNKNASR
jgi:hypothetical protein